MPPRQGGTRLRIDSGSRYIVLAKFLVDNVPNSRGTTFQCGRSGAVAQALRPHGCRAEAASKPHRPVLSQLLRATTLSPGLTTKTDGGEFRELERRVVTVFVRTEAMLNRTSSSSGSIRCSMGAGNSGCWATGKGAGILCQARDSQRERMAPEVRPWPSSAAVRFSVNQRQSFTCVTLSPSSPTRFVTSSPL